MKHWMLFLLMVLGGARALPQQAYFIYLQTDNHQAFYIRMGDRVYSSTSSGYCILPQLADSSYQLIAGFPGNAFPEQSFTVDIHHKDAGYLLKNFGDKGWGLFNLQSLAVIMNSNAATEKKSPDFSATKKTDAFSTLLANAVNDTSILYVTRLVEPAPAKAIVKTESDKNRDTVATAENPAEKISAPVPQPATPTTDATTLVKKAPPAVDTAVVAKITAPVADTAVALVADSSPAPVAIKKEEVVAKKEAPAITTTPAEKTNTLKVAELLTDTSYIAVYTDGTLEKFDTIRISIPLDKPGIQIQEAPRSAQQPAYNLPETAARKDSTQKDTLQAVARAVPEKQAAPEKQAETVTAPPKTKKDSTTHDHVDVLADTLHINPAPEKPLAPDTATTINMTRTTDSVRTQTAARPPLPNSDCKNLAWDSDIDKLRVKMLALKTDDNRILLVKKFFKQKCMLVKQVRALSELFATDEGKYKWFDAAYPSVSDVGNFPQLGELIKDNYYLSRFKAMIRH